MKPLFISILFLLVACTPHSSHNIYDITTTDFVEQNLTSKQLSVENITLGMSFEEVIAARGYPQKIDDLGNVTNYYYKENETPLFVVNFDRGVVRRITLSSQYPRLVGESKYGRSKEEVYQDFGIANEFIDQGRIRRFIYNQKGYELFLKGSEHIGYSFFPPTDELGDHKIINTSNTI
ncbi:hypothetical protein D6774_03765 [Candidatus Woesearchaeota archaeon]|nr:MAG: hypothetical protein D6774_03765 [Candidatus Woesearchaeota archaeon]